MQKKTRSILEELEQIHQERDSRHIIESRAENIIASSIRLLDLIEESYTPEEAENLSRKLLNSIKLRDSQKFKRSIARINESRDKK